LSENLGRLRVLVTGGAGFIGSHLVDSLMRDGHDVVVLDDFSSGNIENIKQHLGEGNFHLIKGDIRNRGNVEGAVKDADVVYHLAAIISIPLSIENPALVEEVNVRGTLKVLEASLRHNVERFVYISTCAVYGEAKHLPINEEHQTEPLSPYGVSKLAAEHFCRVMYHVHSFPTICLRFFNVYGTRQQSGPYSSVITTFLELVKHDKPLVIYGDGNQTRDFLYVDDAVEACLLAARCRKSCFGGVFNVGAGIQTSIKDLARMLIDCSGKPRVKVAYEEARRGEIRDSCADITKAREKLKFMPKTSILGGLEKLSKTVENS
jgi:UDP-glucose 4-epimerase